MLIYYLINRKETDRPLSSQPAHIIDFRWYRMYKQKIYIMSLTEREQSETGDRSGTLSEGIEGMPPSYEKVFALALAQTGGAAVLPPHQWPSVVRSFQDQCPGVLENVHAVNLAQTLRHVGIVRQDPDSGCWTASIVIAEKMTEAFADEFPSEPIGILAGMLRAPQARTPQNV